jgi:drug/metabolite transporter (DMT)-like permease
VAWRLGYLRGLRSKTKPLIAFAIAECALPWWLIPLGQEGVSSSLAAILIASLPLLTALIALRVDPAERVVGIRFGGLLIGLAGVVLLLGVDVAGRPGELLGAAAILAATTSYAIGLFMVKRYFADVNPIGAVAAALGLSAILLAPAGLVLAPGAEVSGPAVGSVLVLGAFCSALALVLFFRLVAEVGPSRTSIITYVNPAVAVVLGVTLLGESLGPGAVAGLLLIVAGSWLSTGGGTPPGLAAIITRVRSHDAHTRRGESSASAPPLSGEWMRPSATSSSSRGSCASDLPPGAAPTPLQDA